MRKKEYMAMVNHYCELLPMLLMLCGYVVSVSCFMLLSTIDNLVTDFYEYGWGYCFHFGRRYKGEDFHASLARHEQWLASKARFTTGQTIIDIGCGVGGPMRAIARFTGANIVGVNNNAYQITRGVKQVAAAGLTSLCTFKQCDFMNLDFKANSVDGAYAIEATCHAPDKTACFREIYRTLKPGALFTGYDWCMTDKYDAKNPTHVKIKAGIEVGDGLPDICHTSDMNKALVDAGFELIDSKDIAPLDSINDVNNRIAVTSYVSSHDYFFLVIIGPVVRNNRFFWRHFKFQVVTNRCVAYTSNVSCTGGYKSSTKGIQPLFSLI